MARIYLVDAFNLIHAVPALRRLLQDAGPAAVGQELVDQVRTWLDGHPRPPQVVLVFDGPGPPPGKPSPGLEVRYMDHQADADLAALLERRGQRILVSADGELVRRARNLGCPVEAPLAFYRELRAELALHAELAERERVPDAAETRAWLEAFGGERGPAPAPPQTEGPLDAEQVRDWLDYFGAPPEG